MGQQYVVPISQSYGIPQQTYCQQAQQQQPTSTVAPASSNSNLAAFSATALSAGSIVGAVQSVVPSTTPNTTLTDHSTQILLQQNAQPKRERRVLKIINPETQECLNENDVARSEATATESNNNENFIESVSETFSLKCKKKRKLI